MAEPKQVLYYFDPACPWTWRTSLWLREVRKVRPLSLEWSFVSLAVLNSPTDNMRELGEFWSKAALQTLVLAKRTGGDAAVDKLYMELGQARHTRGEDLDNPQTIENALEAAGLERGLLAQALADPTTLDDLQQSHDHVTKELKGIGSPGLVLKDGKQEGPVWYGPIINAVPEAEAAGQFWDNLLPIIERGDFFELKRNR